MSELGSLSQCNASAQRNNDMFAKVESQRGSFEQLDSLKAQRAILAAGSIVGPDDKETYSRLMDSAAEKRASYRAVDDSRNGLLKGFPGNDDSKARARRSEIRDVLDRRGEYLSRRSAPVVDTATAPKLRLPLTVMLLAAAAVSFAFLPMDITVRAVVSGALAASAAGVFLLWKGPQVSPSAGNEGWIQRYESQVRSISSSCGTPDISIDRQLEVLEGYEKAMGGLDALNGRWSELRMEQMKADNGLLVFLTRFGGAEGYQTALTRSSELERIDVAISTLRKGIIDSGFDPDAPLPDISKVEVDASRQSEVSRELGALRERMKAVLDTEALDSLIDRCYMILKDRESILRACAVAVLSSKIVEDACEGQYTEVRPGVVQTADRYIGMMTMGAYHLDTDPRSRELTVVNGIVTKGPKQWSTGLRAQVMLSLKLAIAKELGSGEVPMMLDDVLLPFDSMRMDGACAALAQVSKEMQILLFTCDDRVVKKCQRLPEVCMILMKTD